MTTARCSTGFVGLCWTLPRRPGSPRMDPLPESLQHAHDAYTAEIRRLDAEIAGLDQRIANEEEQNR